MNCRLETPGSLKNAGWAGTNSKCNEIGFELIYSTPVAGAVGKWEARFAFHFSMARRGNDSWTGALTDV